MTLLMVFYLAGSYYVSRVERLGGISISNFIKVHFWWDHLKLQHCLLVVCFSPRRITRASAPYGAVCGETTHLHEGRGETVAEDVFCISSAAPWTPSWSLVRRETQSKNAMTLSSLWGAEEDCGITKGLAAKRWTPRPRLRECLFVKLRRALVLAQNLC